MFKSRGMYCGCCSRKRFAKIENGKLEFVCSNCNVRVISRRQNDEKVKTSYRFTNTDWFLEYLYCENCKEKHNVNSDCKNEFKTNCCCGYSIHAKRSNVNDLIVTTYLIK